MADSSTGWNDLRPTEETYPVQVAKYAVTNKLVHGPVFSWWVPHTLKKRD